ncbi:hypothetical protein CTI14_63435, partial [Methylobacterium radiotolerans]
MKVGEVLRNQKGARNPRALKVTREGQDVTNPEIEISRHVLLDIAADHPGRHPGAEIASAPMKVGEVLRNQKGARNPRALKVTREGQDV